VRFPSTFPLLALALASSTSAIFPSSPLNDEGSSVLLPTEPQVIIDENVYVVPHKSLAESFGLRESEGRDAAEKVRKDQTVEEHMLAEKIVPLWIGERKESLRDSPLAAVHIAAGSFETARTVRIPLPCPSSTQPRRLTTFVFPSFLVPSSCFKTNSPSPTSPLWNRSSSPSTNPRSSSSKPTHLNLPLHSTVRPTESRSTRSTPFPPSPATTSSRSSWEIWPKRTLRLRRASGSPRGSSSGRS
jgi:hypothetical protein